MILCLVFMFFAIPSPRAEALVGFDDLAFALIGTLAAFGLSFSAAGGIDAVGPWIVDRFEDFVVSAGDTLSTVVDNMRYGVNKAGDLIGNAYALSYNARFAQWLQSEYDLSSNVTVDTNPPVVSVSLPHLPSNSSFDLLSSQGVLMGSSYYAVVLGAASSSSPGISFDNMIFYPCFIHTNTYTRTFLTFSDSLPSQTIYNINLLMRTQNGSVQIGQLSLTPFGDGYFYTSWGGIANPTPGVPVFDSLSDAFSYFDFSPSPSADSIVISTGSLSIPQTGDYSDDDGILIDGLGSWGDSLQDIWNKISGFTFPDVSIPTVSWGAEAASVLVDALVSAGELTTENSPGFYNGLPLIGGIPDIQFGNLWHYVTDWVGSMSGGLALIGGIMFSLPFVAAFYALVVILLVLSLWRLLRSA